jgi:hypothetical protein
VCANQGGQVHGVSSDTLVRLASGLDVRCVKKQWLGCVSEDARMGVVVMRQDSSQTIEYHEIGEKKGSNFLLKKIEKSGVLQLCVLF